MSDTRSTTGGFEDRFRVTRTDGKRPSFHRRYFVIAYEGSDPHAKAAMTAYADSIEGENPELASDLRDALVNPHKYPKQHD